MSRPPGQTLSLRNLASPQRVVLIVIGVAIAMQAWLRSTRWRGVVVSNEGSTFVYQPSTWWLAIFAVIVGLFLVMGVAVVRMKFLLTRVLGGFVLLATLVMVIVIPPTILDARLVVTPEGFTHRVGFWWRPVTQDVRFDSLESIRLVSDSKGGEFPSLVIECRGKDGGIVRISRSDNLKRAIRRIALYATRRGVGVTINDPTVDAAD